MPSLKSGRQPLQAVFMLLVTVFNYFFSSIVGGILIYFGYAVLHGHAAASAWQANSVSAQFVYTLIVYALLIGTVAVVFRSWWHLHRSDIGWLKPRLVDPLYALMALPIYYVVYYVAILIISALVPEFNASQSQQLGFNQASGGGQLTLVFLSLVVIPPVIEEIVFRGYLYGGLKKTLPKFWAVLLATLLFAIAHLEFGNGGPLVWVAAVFTFVLALALTLLRELTGRLWAGIFLHALVNGISFFFLFVVGTR